MRSHQGVKQIGTNLVPFRSVVIIEARVITRASTQNYGYLRRFVLGACVLTLTRGFLLRLFIDRLFFRRLFANFASE